MVDISKRRSLKSIGALMAAPLVPASLVSTSTLAMAKESNVTIENVGGNEELSISLELKGTPMMRVTNNSSSLTILRRINPGVVVVGDKTYDLNHSLYSNAHGISAGESRLFPIVDTTGSKHAKPAFANKYSRKMLKVAQITTDGVSANALNTSRAFFS